MHMEILPTRRVILIAASLIVVALAVVYGPSLRHGFVNLDDDVLLEQNPVVRGLSANNIAAAFTTYDPELYVPLTMLTYQAEYTLAGGLSPALIHTDNLLLHALSSLLVAWIIFLLFGDVIVAILCGLLFAMHPLNSEAVAWASARKDVLSSAFLFASLGCYIAAKKTSVRTWYRASVVLFAAALLSKASVLMLPFTLLLGDWMSKGKLEKKDWTEKSPFFALSVLFGCVALFGKTSVLSETPTFQKILLVPVSAAFALYKFFAPVRLSVLYPFVGTPSATSLSVWVSCIVILLVLALCIAVRKRSRLPLAGFGFFLLMLLPSFLNVSRGGDIHFASDRYSYVPMLGLLMVTAYFFSLALQRRPKMSLVIAGCVILASAMLAATQAGVWKNSEKLHTHVLKYYPHSFAAENNLGMWNMNLGRFDSAIEHFDAALSIHESVKVTTNKATAHQLNGKPEEALKLLEPVFAQNDVPSDAYLTAGNAYRQLGKEEEAISEYRKAIETNPDAILAYNNLGVLYLSMSRWDDASDILTAAAAAKKTIAPDVYFNLAIAEEQRGNIDLAIAAYAKATALRPDDTEALANLATLLFKVSKFDQAKPILDHLLKIDPENIRGRTLQKLLD